MARIALPNNCSFTQPVIIPKNWDRSGARTDALWSIMYRFHDPAYAAEYPEGKRIKFRGMNSIKGIADRRHAVRELIKNEIEKLSQGFNPITGSMAPSSLMMEIEPGTVILEALTKAHARLHCGARTKSEIRKALVYIGKAVARLKYKHIPVSQVKRKHIRFILDQIGQDKGGWTAANFNHYRAYIKILFNELIEVEATELDPTSHIKKMKATIAIRKTLTLGERKTVDEHLRANYYTFWRFMHIFFHSGARVSELMRLRMDDVDIDGQRFKVMVQKGRSNVEEWKTIKDISRPLWEEVCSLPGEFVFSKGLVPGSTAISETQITRRWRRHVKTACGITADFYSLKHSHSSEVVDMLSLREAAAHNSHADESMVARVYDIHRNTRERDRVKGLNNPF